MASEPTVVCLMLTRDRPEMARRAVECFRRQTYPAKRLYIFDTGDTPCTGILPGGYPDDNIVYHRGLQEGLSVGALRNRANWWGVRPTAIAPPDADIIMHFDDDDWSHPERIAEQVALLKASGAAAVGYNEMLFWRDGEPPRYGKISEFEPAREGEAWLYRGSILGTSLCYWRETWERVPFRAIRLNPNHQQGTGEDHDFLLDLPAAGMKTAQQSSVPMSMEQARALAFPEGPRMIGGIHGANTSGAYDPAQMHAHPQHWTRVPQWDQFCLETMKI